jgi:hypothetical protein
MTDPDTCNGALPLLLLAQLATCFLLVLVLLLALLLAGHLPAGMETSTPTPAAAAPASFASVAHGAVLEALAP